MIKNRKVGEEEEEEEATFGMSYVIFSPMVGG